VLAKAFRRHRYRSNGNLRIPEGRFPFSIRSFRPAPTEESKRPTFRQDGPLHRSEASPPPETLESAAKVSAACDAIGPATVIFLVVKREANVIRLPLSERFKHFQMRLDRSGSIVPTWLCIQDRHPRSTASAAWSIRETDTGESVI